MAVDVEELRAGGDLAVPAGDPEALRAAGRRMQRVAARALATAAVRGECGPVLALHWQGVVADAAGVELGQLSARAMRLLPGVGAGGAALGRYAEALADAQARVRALQGQAVEAREDHRRAVATADAVGVDPAARAALVARADRELQERLLLVRRGYGRVLDELTADGSSCARVLTGLAGEAGQGRGALGVRERVLDRLFVAQHEIGQAAVRPVGQVAEREPETWYETAAVTAGDAAAWTWNHTAVPFVNGAANVGEAILEHPEDVLELALGVGGMVVGAGGELGGLALDATVVGAPAGAAVHVASTGLIVAGTAAAAHGAGNLAQHALENDNRWLSEVSGPGGGTRIQRGQPGDPLPDSARPDVAGANWRGRVADNGKGEVWQAPEHLDAPPGTPRNADTVRIAYPDERYPHGCVRFYNKDGQPLRLDGRPGSNAETHIEIREDGTFDVPKGWKQ